MCILRLGVIYILPFFACFVVSGELKNKLKEHDNQKILRKRFATNEPNKLWPKAIVPYVIQPDAEPYRKEYERVMALFEENSCIRFLPWNETKTKVKNSVNHKGHLNFIRSPGCFSSSNGISSSSKGQNISCCQGKECVHEIGHSLGFYHEQESPLRNGWVRINWNNIWPGQRSSYKMSQNKHDLSHMYDISSVMHNPPNLYSNGKPTETVLFPELNLVWDYYYFFMELADIYQCREWGPCKGKNVTCVNDGYLTVVHGKCQCKCPSGLDPQIGCQEPLKKVDSSWPEGSYFFTSLQKSCPENFMMMALSVPKDLKMHEHTIDGTAPLKYHYFCESPTPSSQSPNKNWPVGQYCVFIYGKCPNGFVNGRLSIGKLSRTVVHKPFLEFCCKYEGFHKDPISLPTKDAFYLLRVGTECQQVQGMRVEKQSIIYTGKNLDVEGPLSHYKSEDNTSLTVNVCNYTPVNTDCGEGIELSKTKNSVIIDAQDKNTGMECTWVIHGDSDKGTLVLDFEEFDVAKDGQICDDKVEVRHARIGQVGLNYCGKDVGHTIRSITNKMLVKFSTSGNSKSSFKASVKWVPDETLCYDVNDGGSTYNGKVNFTRIFESCLPWAQVTDCPHHPFNSGDEQDNLEGNYCRNPDNSLRPWCYTDIDGCQRNYCDVCGLEIPHDHEDYCEQLKDVGFCTTEPIKALQQCPNTCLPQLTEDRGSVKVYSSIQCGKPHVPEDAILMDMAKIPAKLGDEVRFQCRNSDRVVATKCLSSGDWSPIKYACLECPPGFASFDNSCYGLLEDPESLTFKEAQERCNALNGTVAFPRSEKEASIITHAARLSDVWISVSDQITKGNWLPNQGVESVWNNWERGQPTDIYSGERCATIDGYSKWQFTPCTYQRSAVCTVPKLESSFCEDFLGDACTKLLDDRPTMCKDFPDFVSVYCRKSCAICQTDYDTRCSVLTTNPNVLTLSTKQNTIGVGEYVTYACEKGTYIHHGNEKRVCLANGKLSEEPLLCGVCPLEYRKAQNQCYNFIEGQTFTFDEARKECQQSGGYIAMPKNEEQNELIQSLGMGETLWIGLSSIHDKGTFMYEDLSKQQWSNWTYGEPNLDTIDGSCVIVTPNKEWKTKDCSSEKFSVVCTLPTTESATRCFDLNDKGASYNGKVSRTYKNQNCLPWVEATACDHHPFKVGDELANLDKNYCRNPNGADHPWCYTYGCNWDYCNVCKEDKAVDCGRPVPPPEGQLVGFGRSTYHVGETVTFKCKDRGNMVKQKCLSDGQWFPTGLLCTEFECPDGYSRYENTCYVYIDKQLSYDQAKDECNKTGGFLPKPKTAEENEFVTSLNHGKYTWIGARRRMNSLQPFLWSDGTKVHWANWKMGFPNRYPCAYMNPDGTWDDTDCDFMHKDMRLMCAINKLGSTDCADYLDTQCSSLLQDLPSMCLDYPAFAEKFCAKSCGICEDGSVECMTTLTFSGVTVSTKYHTIPIGSYVKYGCSPYKYYDKGDKIGVCRPDGTMSGKPLQCKFCPDGQFLFGDSCYSLNKQVLTMADARVACKDINGFIASPRSENELDFIASLLSAKSKGIWLGMTDLLNENRFLHEDGSRVTYTFWATNEPKVSETKGCTYMQRNKQWVDVSCDASIRYQSVCQVPVIDVDDQSTKCYNVIDGGASYSGFVRRSVTNMECLPWSRMTNCPVHPFKEGYERSNLDSNYCRNPDNSRRPWCYTDAVTCDKQYCDVCKPSCPSGFTLFQNVCYKYIGQQQQYTQADQVCKKEYNGHLLVPQSYEEKRFISSILPSDTQIWIGVIDIMNKGHLVSEDGTTITESNWAPGEPRNASTNVSTTSSSKNAVMIGLDHLWHSVPDNLYLSFVCAFPATFIDPVEDVNNGCFPPVAPSDGVIESELKASFNVGETVTIKCTNSNAKVKTTCLSSGNWSSVGLACTECPFGFKLSNGLCHGYVDTPMNYPGAKEFCQKYNGSLATPKNKEENDFIASLMSDKEIWLGANDVSREGTFVWDNGNYVSWTNWNQGEPNDDIFGEDGVTLSKQKTWHDRAIWLEMPFVCSVPKNNHVLCKDFLLDQCPDLFETSPTMCTEYPKFAATFCAATCGVCGSENTRCSKLTKVGENKTESCTKMSFVTSGNTIRGCKADGTWTGHSPTCQGLREGTMSVGNSTYSGPKNPKLPPNYITYATFTKSWLIPSNGIVVAWVFKSDYKDMEILFQIYREVPGDDGSFYLLGQNKYISKTTSSSQYYIVPREERISVMSGDQIGVTSQNSNGVHYSRCHGKYLHHSKTIPGTSVGDTIKFFASRGCVQFAFEAILLPSEKST